MNSLTISESKIFYIFKSSFPKRLNAAGTTLHFNDQKVNFFNIKEINVSPISFWLNIFGYSRLSAKIELNDNICNLSFIVKKNQGVEFSQALVKKVQELLLEMLCVNKGKLEIDVKKINTFFEKKFYIRRSNLELFKKQFQKKLLHSTFANISSILGHPLLSNDEKTQPHLNEHLALLNDLYSQVPRKWINHNNNFIKNQKIEYKDFFDSIEDMPLTEQQRDASLVFDDANIAVAAAGSGKTSVLVAKAGFAISSGYAAPFEILCLAFNKAAADEIGQRAKEKLSKFVGSNTQIEARTFHSIGRQIMGVAPCGKPYNVVKLNYDSNSDADEGLIDEGTNFAQVFNDLKNNNPEFQSALLDWIAYADTREPKLDPFNGDVTDAEVCEKRYFEACFRKLSKKSRGGNQPYQPSIPTLEGTKVRSFQEAKIVNWLYLHDVPFAYEKETKKPLNEAIPTKLKQSKFEGGKPYRASYYPDFVFTTITGEKKEYIYHEHFGLDENGKAPDFMGGVKYESYAENKRNAFKKVYGNQFEDFFFETRSGDFYDGSIFSKLEQSLKERGVHVGDVNLSKKNSALQAFGMNDNKPFYSLLKSFITSFRDSGYDVQHLNFKTNELDEPYRAKLFLNLAMPIVEALETKLDRNKEIEFSDMLRKGAIKANAIKERALKPLPYKLILVDEFQDISKLKIDLVRAIGNACSEPPVLFFVGDDWQSINRFAGSDLGLFKMYTEFCNQKTGHTNRSSTPGYVSTHVIKLTETFRSPQGISDVSREVVMKNTCEQVDKVVKSRSPRVESTIRIVGHNDDSNGRLEALKLELNRLESLAEKTEKLITVFILTRNKAKTVVPEGLEHNEVEKIFQLYPYLKIEVGTMHSSKGLQADYTVICGMEAGYKGFPSEMENDPIMDIVLPYSSGTLSEERRLFYVGLTRSKIQTILLTTERRASRFIKEFKTSKFIENNFEFENFNFENIKDCPSCKFGTLYTNKKKVEKCTRNPVCGYKNGGG
jgi:DNA helicase-4